LLISVIFSFVYILKYRIQLLVATGVYFCCQDIIQYENDIFYKSYKC